MMAGVYGQLGFGCRKKVYCRPGKNKAKRGVSVYVTQ